MKKRNLAAVAGQLLRAVSALATRSASDVKRRSVQKLTILFHCIGVAPYSILAILLRFVKIVTRKFHV